MVKSKKFYKKYAHKLIAIARGDLESTFDLLRANTKRKENVYLLAQQSLEKGLKAVLCWFEELIPFIYDIGVLVALVSVVAEPPFGYDLNDLTEFAAVRLYFEGFEEFSQEEVSAVLLAVQDALTWCEAKIS